MQVVDSKCREREKAAAERRFEAARAKLEQSVQKHLSGDYDVSSSEEEEELQSDNILGKISQNRQTEANSGPPP